MISSSSEPLGRPPLAELDQRREGRVLTVALTHVADAHVAILCERDR